MQTFSCTSHRSGDTVTVRTAGDVDLAVAARWWEEIRPHIAAGTHLVLDCAGITFFDSMGLRTLALTARSAKETGSELTLAVCSEPVLRTLDLAGMTGLFAYAEQQASPAA